VCVGSAAGQCDVLRVVYDARGDRVAERAGNTWRGFLGPGQVRTIAGGADESRLEITAFGERIAYAIIAKPRVASALPLFDREVPAWLLALPAIAALLAALALAVRGGLVAGFARRPVHAAVTAVLIAAVAIPSPAFAGGGGWTFEFSYRWVLSDALGSGLAVLDEAGLLLHQTRFAPFGGTDAGEYHAAGDPAPRRYFAGHPEQVETGLHYMNARWLDPATGTFLSVDPVVRDVAKSQSLNGYAYAENNPIAFNDPTGACIPPECRTVGLVSSGFIPSHAVVVNPGSLADFGVKPGMVAGDIAAVMAGQNAPGTSAGVGSGVGNAAAAVGGSEIAAASGSASGFWSAIGDSATTVGGMIARVAEIMMWDLALGVVGILGGPIGIGLGLFAALAGVAQLDAAKIGSGIEAILWALVPRYGFWSGPGWGKPNLEAFGWWPGPFSRQNVIEAATYRHDYGAANEIPHADRDLIHDVWSRHDLGAYGQIYRVGLTAVFETRIAVGMGD
jgi:RHS repeat-associated protein